MCGIKEGSAVEHEELSALGLKLDRIAADVSTVIDQNAHQQESLDEVKEMVAAKNSKLRAAAGAAGQGARAGAPRVRARERRGGSLCGGRQWRGF